MAWRTPTTRTLSASASIKPLRCHTSTPSFRKDSACTARPWVACRELSRPEATRYLASISPPEQSSALKLTRSIAMPKLSLSQKGERRARYRVQYKLSSCVAMQFQP